MTADTMTTILFITSYILIILLFYLEHRYESLRTTTTLQLSGDDRGTTRLLFIMSILSLVIIAPLSTFLFNSSSDSSSNSVAMSWIGFVFMLISIILLRWTTFVNPFYLRTMATTDDHFICTDGPYRMIRHPGYLAFLLAWIGFGLLTIHWISFIIISLIMTYAYLRRIQAEEQMMLDRFGVDYQHYMNESYRLLPFVY
ncbi:uncharacterized protein BX663DRAFT_456197 [Cokeromyces recurvatus]|uniref:uncharacterized protein n=1 Tax=Cokeromyces recurvatus TaxID=90255 RepID=UPI00221F41AD|nr:uncharacterized protein BX663DRAFT_456197 [Cokeromyces recurvatus]KAI7901907.1 hypothetical protein BX663DRAFT_456197 [Cokeromyces recurvatus]